MISDSKPLMEKGIESLTTDISNDIHNEITNENESEMRMQNSSRTVIGGFTSAF